MQNYKGPKWVDFPSAAETTEGRVTCGDTGFGAIDPDKLQVNASRLIRYGVGWGGLTMLI